MVEYFPAIEQIESLEELRHFGVINHRHVEQAVVGHRIGCEPISRGIANGHRHHLAFQLIVVDFEVHLIFQSLEHHFQRRRDHGERIGPQPSRRFPSHVHDRCHKSDIEAVVEIAVAPFALGIGITDTSEVNFPCAPVFQHFHHLVEVIVLDAPEMREIVHLAIGNDPQPYLVACLFVSEHEAVDGIVERRVAPHHDDGLISVVDHHGNQSVDGVGLFALDEIIVDMIESQCFFYLLPPFLGSEATAFRAIDDAPFFLVHSICGYYRGYSY